MSMLEAEKLSKVYKSGTFGGGLKPALRQVSFGIDKGEVVSLIGESGSGKSTLGKMVLRLIPASGGRLLFEGTDVSTLKGRDLHDYYRHVQGVFQDPFSSYNPLYKADRVLELVRQEYFAELSHGDWDAKVAMALETVSLNPADVLNKFPHQLSGGQQQRLLVARALLLDVKLLIADEIISMLDASTRVDVLNMLVSLKKRGLAVLFITHDLSLGNYISDRTIILRYGAVVEMGDTEKVFGNPQHPYTRHLLTAVPQLHRKWQEVDDERRGAEANGSAAARRGGFVTTYGSSSTSPEDPNPRYSKSALHPLNAPGQPEPAGTGAVGVAPAGAAPAGPRPSLMELEDQPWQSRVRPRGRPKVETVIAENAPPDLVEYEAGHFVAVEEATR
jgi:peptide/nickel transport system ATP-binding protein